MFILLKFHDLLFEKWLQQPLADNFTCNFARMCPKGIQIEVRNFWDSRWKGSGVLTASLMAQVDKLPLPPPPPPPRGNRVKGLQRLPEAMSNFLPILLYRK